VVGTGGLKKYTEEIGVLKRLWLLEKYHGRKIGYQVVLHLLAFPARLVHTRLHANAPKTRTRNSLLQEAGLYRDPELSREHG